MRNWKNLILSLSNIDAFFTTRVAQESSLKIYKKEGTKTSIDV
jgi:hypothetical protein